MQESDEHKKHEKTPLTLPMTAFRDPFRQIRLYLHDKGGRGNHS